MVKLLPRFRAIAFGWEFAIAHTSKKSIFYDLKPTKQIRPDRSCLSCCSDGGAGEYYGDRLTNSRYCNRRVVIPKTLELRRFTTLRER
ncbi:MAG: hypothetical protein RMY28_004310 [Nostoc sp. ChiSLP01]|nr:hypothetical protein [Nostoc sp. CmiSLP01]MDZ8283955.1 hypothetical protein [Nostoc sp. ChiSLP01]